MRYNCITIYQKKEEEKRSFYDVYDKHVELLKSSNNMKEGTIRNNSTN